MSSTPLVKFRSELTNDEEALVMLLTTSNISSVIAIGKDLFIAYKDRDPITIKDVIL